MTPGSCAAVTTSTAGEGTMRARATERRPPAGPAGRASAAAGRLLVTLAAAALLVLATTGLVTVTTAAPAQAAPPASACPAGTTFHDGRCVGPAAPHCDSQHALDGDRCTMPASRRCDTGQLSGTTCVSPAAQPCPAGGSPDGSRCVSTPVHRCSDGTASGTTCTMPARAPCSSGTRDGSVCVQAGPVCPASGAEGTAGNQCWAYQTGTCPPPGSLEGPVTRGRLPSCAADLVNDQCPDGYTYVGPVIGLVSSQRDVYCEAPATAVCPQGFTSGPDSGLRCYATLECRDGTLGEDGRCTTPAAEPCPAGWTATTGGTCTRPATATCPRSGETLGSDNRCSHPADPPCTTGTPGGAGTCVTPATEFCPAGTGTLTGGTLCVLPPTSLCTPPSRAAGTGQCSTPPVCASGTAFDGNGGCAVPPSGCPAGTTPDGHGRCLPATGTTACPDGLVHAADGACRQPPPTPSDPPPPGTPATPGTMTTSPEMVPAGDPITATGAGCDPGADVVLRSGGEQVGHTTADGQGRFSTPVLFSTFAAGERVITADCGPTLTTTVAMTLADASQSTTQGYVVLTFFLAAGFLVVRWHLGPSRR